MASTYSGRLTADALEEVRAGYSLFKFQFSVKYWCTKVSENRYTPYHITIFGKDTQAEYYRDVLKKGVVAEISCKKLKACIGIGQNGGKYAYIETIKATLENVWNVNQGKKED